ncbi:Kinesin-like protein KIFC3, partial [Ophiophagus hannah]
MPKWHIIGSLWVNLQLQTDRNLWTYVESCRFLAQKAELELAQFRSWLEEKWPFGSTAGLGCKKGSFPGQGKKAESLKDRLPKAAQEMNRLHSTLELKLCEAQLQELRKLSVRCSNCAHSQENVKLQEKLAQVKQEAEDAKGRLSELELEVEQKTNRLAEVELRLKDSLAERAEEEERLSRRLRDSQEVIASLKAQPHQVKYVIKTMEVESSKTKQALSEAQSRNQYLQDQVGMQRQVLKEMEQQLQSSQKAAAQLRAQSREQMLEEMQNMEEDKNRAIEEAFARAQLEMKAVHENLAGVRANLLTLQPALRTLTSDYNSLKRQVKEFPLLLQEALQSARTEIGQAIEEVSSTNQELLRKYRKELQLRKKCHNELVRLKGNIRVFGRVRPVQAEDGEGPEAVSAVTFDSEDDGILHLMHKGKLVSFELDKVFRPEATQEDVFREVQALITSCIDGYNVCIFAYGQTGAGKTYTMEGSLENPGINQRALQLLFSEVQSKAPDWNYSITVSVAEIYNEALRLREFHDSPSTSPQVFELGHINRATECTHLNEHSSRSHALLMITVRGTDCSTGIKTTGKLNLVDLAGSERVGRSGAEGSRLREAQYINKSLSALGDVIYALRSRQSHVPFRNSKLTYLLQDSLSGESKTLMMVQVSPVEKNTSETLCSLKFAERVRSVELGPGSRRAEVGSWTSQEHLEVEPSITLQPCIRTQPSPRTGRETEATSCMTTGGRQEKLFSQRTLGNHAGFSKTAPGLGLQAQQPRGLDWLSPSTAGSGAGWFKLVAASSSSLLLERQKVALNMTLKKYNIYK